jgi:O-antigen/teichoic acid export membrane protein
MVLVTLNTFTDSVFLVNRATKYNVIIYGAYSLLRLSLPFAFVRYGIIGIFGAHIAGVALAVFLSFYYMVRKLNYRFSFTFSKSIARMIGGYSAASYVAGFLWVLPMLIAPVFVVNQLGTQTAAYFYMVNTIVSCLLIIPLATTQALFAEGSHATHELRQLVRKSLRLTMTLVALGVVGLLALGKLVILVFGHEYVQGLGLLYLLTATTLIVALNMTGNAILKIRQQTWRLISVNLLATLLAVGTFKLFMQHYGLLGIGVAYLLGQAVMLCAFGGMLLVERLSRQRSSDRVSLSAQAATK